MNHWPVGALAVAALSGITGCSSCRQTAPETSDAGIAEAPDARAPKAPGEWSFYGGDEGGMRYSPLTDINRGNVGQLKVAWTFHTGDMPSIVNPGSEGEFETTPILVDGTLYLSTPYGKIFAIDPETGAEKWSYAPLADRPKGLSNPSRGVAAWLDATRGEGAPCRRRIFVGTFAATLHAVDAATGRPCSDFGEGGKIDVRARLGGNDQVDVHVTSPPAIFRDLVIVGAQIDDNQDVESPSGAVQAFDARTGALRWSFDPIPRDPADPARATWEGDSADHTGGANAWSIMSVDVQRELVFVPTTSPSPDWYGGKRGGQNRYASSIVALHASTGKVAWHFQTVHHDLWDYDNPAEPALITVKRDGRAVPAVAAATKMGHLFLLDRDTGAPLFPVNEKPVPASTVPGEKSSPTQPFPDLPPALVPQKLSPADAWGPNPSDRAWCRKHMEAMSTGPIFTPPSLRGTVAFPGNIGGMHWGGVSFDPERGLLVTNTNRLAALMQIVPKTELSGDQENWHDEWLDPLHGTPYKAMRKPFFGPSGLPCTPPPWGTLVAVDVATGSIRWEVPLGTMAKQPDAEKWGSINLGGSIVTAGGLVFIAASVDAALHAFDIETGRKVWEGPLPTSAKATPMTYKVRDGGKQYVVVAAGGFGIMRDTPPADAIVAFALP